MKSTGNASDGEEAGPDRCLFYRDRPEWKDVTPIPQDDGNEAIVQINYSEKFRDVYDYLRAVMNANEKSERALELTHDAIILNSANYTVWQYRREILNALNCNLEEELAYIQRMIEDNPKNYQVWHHRQVIVEMLQDPSRELESTAQVLESDGKNYHAWQHRQWVIKTFGLWDKELSYVDSLLEDDIRNNSAWNQRYFVIRHTSQFVGENLRKEIDFTKSCIKTAVNNESPWNYLRGILSGHSLSEFPDIKEFCTEMYEAKHRSPYLLSFILDVYADEMEKDVENRPTILKKALELCADLAAKHDTIRTEYWKYQARNLAHKYREITGSSGEA